MCTFQPCAGHVTKGAFQFRKQFQERLISIPHSYVSEGATSAWTYANGEEVSMGFESMNVNSSRMLLTRSSIFSARWARKNRDDYVFFVHSPRSSFALHWLSNSPDVGFV
jgi:hypothetical protein